MSSRVRIKPYGSRRGRLRLRARGVVELGPVGRVVRRAVEDLLPGGDEDRNHRLTGDVRRCTLSMYVTCVQPNYREGWAS